MIEKLKIHKLKILGGVLGIIVFAGAVFGAYKLSQKQIQLTPIVIATPTPDPTADWNTYTNERFKYSIKYPSNWTLREFPDARTGAGFQPLGLPSKIENEAISVDIISRPGSYKDTPFEEYIKIVGIQDIQGFVELDSIKPVSSRYGVKGYVTTWKIEGIRHQKGISGPVAYLEVIPPRHQIEAGLEEKYDIVRLSLLREEHQSIFNLMLSTFKFLE